MILISIDPGTKYTGYAVLKTPRVENGREMFLSQYGLLTPGGDRPDWTIRARMIAAKIQQLFMQIEPNRLVIEWPEFQSGQRGYDAARQGSTLKLAGFCGFLLAVWDLYGARMRQEQRPVVIDMPALITPSQWKGEVPKPVTQSRVNEKFGLELKNGIEWNCSDAIGLGAWAVEHTGYKINTALNDVVKREDY